MATYLTSCLCTLQTYIFTMKLTPLRSVLEAAVRARREAGAGRDEASADLGANDKNRPNRQNRQNRPRNQPIQRPREAIELIFHDADDQSLLPSPIYKLNDCPSYNWDLRLVLEQLNDMTSQLNRTKTKHQAGRGTNPGIQRG